MTIREIDLYVDMDSSMSIGNMEVLDSSLNEALILSSSMANIGIMRPMKDPSNIAWRAYR